MNTFMAIVAVMGALGIPSIFGFTMWSVGKCKGLAKELKILMNAQQAQMRGQLLKDYYFYMNKGYVTEMEMADWENQYQAYHALGANGILDIRREQLMQLECREK